MLRRHRIPPWWSDAKLGIFVHWTPASVPGWAPVDSPIGELMAAGRPDALAETPYTEWYQNSLRFPHSSVARHHRSTYGTKPYAEFASEWVEALAGWDPGDWARTFAEAGARYVVLVAKHHDGFCLWPTGVPHPRGRQVRCERDVVGELAEAVRGVGMRFGLYYSGGLDWTFDDRPIGNLGDLLAAVPRGTYPAYAEAQVRELVRRYRPDVLWNDIAWPGRGPGLWLLMLDYYRQVPDGVLNDRWMPWSPLLAPLQWAPARRLVDLATARAAKARGGEGVVPPRPPHFDVRTPEYTSFDETPSDPWECVRGMDQSFGYNRNSSASHFIARDELLGLFARVVSSGGNLLLNVGPRGEDAQIPDEQLLRLDWLARWTGGPGAVLYRSRPWVRPAVAAADGTEVRLVAGGDTVWAVVLGEVDSELALPGVAPTPRTRVRLVEGSVPGDGRPLAWDHRRGAFRVRLPERFDHPVVELASVVAAPT